jgi:hypothetical protein
MPSRATSRDNVFAQPTSDRRSAFEIARLGMGATTPEELLTMMRPHERPRMRVRTRSVIAMTDSTTESNCVRPAEVARQVGVSRRLVTRWKRVLKEQGIECLERAENPGAPAPLERYLAGPNVGRKCPGSEVLRDAFRIEVKRRQRRSDGTVSLHGQRLEIPSRYRHLSDVYLRYARWDLSPGTRRAQPRWRVEFSGFRGHVL